MSRVISFTLSEDTAKTDLLFYAGEDGVIHCQIMPVENITGWALKCTARKTLSVLPVLFTKIIAGGITITDAPNGKFDITILSADTTGVAPGSYFFDIQRTDAGFKSELGIGTLTIAQPVATL